MLKALVFQLVESKALSKFWFQAATCISLASPYIAAVVVALKWEPAPRHSTLKHVSTPEECELCEGALGGVVWRRDWWSLQWTLRWRWSEPG